MLVLSRKVGEVINVGDNIRITVVDVRGDKVRLGVLAPAEVIVDRAEVHEKRKNSFGEGAALAPTPTGISNALRLLATQSSPHLPGRLLFNKDE